MPVSNELTAAIAPKFRTRNASSLSNNGLTLSRRHSRVELLPLQVALPFSLDPLHLLRVLGIDPRNLLGGIGVDSGNLFLSHCIDTGGLSCSNPCSQDYRDEAYERHAQRGQGPSREDGSHLIHGASVLVKGKRLSGKRSRRLPFPRTRISPLRQSTSPNPEFEEHCSPAARQTRRPVAGDRTAEALLVRSVRFRRI